MSIAEALSDPRFLSGELWARSVLWRESGRAWRRLTDAACCVLPYGPPETPMEQYEVRRYTSEWELVEPAVAREAFRRWCAAQS